MIASRKSWVVAGLLAGTLMLGLGATQAKAQVVYYSSAAPVVAAPPVYYAPPPVVYSPPPVYYSYPAYSYVPYCGPTYRSFSFGWYGGGHHGPRHYSGGFGFGGHHGHHGHHRR